MNWLDKVLIPEWRKALKMMSVNWNLICTAAVPLWLALPKESQDSILSAIGIPPAYLIAAAFVVGIFARLKSQGIKAEPERKEPGGL